MRYPYKILERKLQRKKSLGAPVHRRGTRVNFILEGYGVKLWTGLKAFRIQHCPTGASGEYYIKPSNFIKGKGFLDGLTDHQFLKKYRAP